MNIRLLKHAWLMIALACTADCASADIATAAQPNIVLIVADDLGYTDIGVFGSDIKTPNIDELANQGITFTNFHTASSCAPTRAMLLSGNNNHIAGIGRQSIRRGRITEGLAGYEGHLSDRVAFLPEVLRTAGYKTYMAGKWHLGYEREYAPSKYGFDRSFNLNGGAGNHFDETGIDAHGSEYYEDGQRVPYPVGRYTTSVYTEKLIQYLDEHGDDEGPFFIYAAYTSPHWPLQVPDEDLNLYDGHFDMGYDNYRELRFRALKRSGVIGTGAQLPPRNPALREWNDLNVDEERREARKMELYAAMVENLDRHIGQLVSHLRSSGRYDNTLILFMSDNGADGNDFYQTGRFSEFLQANYNIDFENMGRAGSFITTGPGWAEASSAAHRLYKGFTTQGGIAAPLIIAGPGVVHRGALSGSYITVSDIAPSLLSVAEATYPKSRRPMIGKSLLPLFSDALAEIYDESDYTIFFQHNRAYLRVGDWKLMNVEGPFDESKFGLYNLKNDPAETTDLSLTNPDKRRELIALWRLKRREMGIVLPEDL